MVISFDEPTRRRLLGYRTFDDKAANTCSNPSSLPCCLGRASCSPLHHSARVGIGSSAGTMQEERRTTSSSSSAMLSSAHHEDDDYQDAVRMNCGRLPPHEDLPSTAVLRRRGVVQRVAGSAVLGALLLLTVLLATTTTRTTPLHWPSFTPPSDPRRSTGLFTTASSAAFPARPTSQATTTWRRYLRPWRAPGG